MKLLCQLIILCIATTVYAQDFKLDNPLDIAPSLSGNFGELRSNHFHAGIDLKTAGKESLEVHAVEDGFVSRIKVSPYGYGKVIYIDHPNGYTTVYAHLRSFSDTIERYAKRIQYEQESFEFDVYPGKEDLPITKDQIIAFSGNTGGSGGPHLHFEIRETTTEVPRNPLLFDFPIGDTKYPQLEAVAIVPMSDKSTVNGKHNTYRSRLNGYEKKYLPNNTIIPVSGPFGVAVRGYDSQNGSGNQNGIFRIECRVDGSFVSSFIADSIAFDQSRYINALIDYPFYYYNSSRYVRLYRISGNLLENTKYHQNGILKLDPGIHTIAIKAFDVHGNTSEATIQVAVSEASDSRSQESEEKTIIPWNVDYFHECESGRFHIPAGATYERHELDFKEVEASGMSNILEIMAPSIPLQFPIKVELKAKDTLDTNTHWMIGRVSKNGGVIQAIPATIHHGYVSAESEAFGRFKIISDNTPPTIIPIRFSNATNYTSGKIKFEITDKLSGINTYRAEVNGKFVLASYDYKQDLLEIDVSDLSKSESLQYLRLIVSDMAGNVATFEGSFYAR